MGTNCSPLVADLFLLCYERDFMMSPSDNTQADVIEAFNSTSRYFDDLLNIDYPYFEGMISQIYPAESQLNKANTSNTEASFLDLHLQFYTDLFHLISMTIAMILITVMFPAPLLMVFTYLNLFALLGCLVIWLILMLVIEV